MKKAQKRTKQPNQIKGETYNTGQEVNCPIRPEPFGVARTFEQDLGRLVERVDTGGQSGRAFAVEISGPVVHLFCVGDLLQDVQAFCGLSQFCDKHCYVLSIQIIQKLAGTKGGQEREKERETDRQLKSPSEL